MAIRQRGGRWQADLTIKGKRYRRDFASAQEAEVWEAQTKAAVLVGQEAPEPARTGAGYTLGQLHHDVSTLPEGRGGWLGLKAEATQVLMGQMAVRFFGKDRQVATIDTKAVDEYVRSLVEARKSGATINRRMAALSKMLKFALRRRYIDRLPDMGRQKESEGRLRFVTHEEEALILATLRLWGEHDIADLAEFLVDTGARLSEALGLPWDDLSDGRVTFWLTKSGHPRTVPLTRRVRDALARRPRDGDGPFTGINRWRLRSVWDRLRGHLKLDDVVIHTLRHTCASRLVQAGVDIRRVQQWMGHKAITVTLRYAHLAPKDLDAAVEALENRGRPALKVV